MKLRINSEYFKPALVTIALIAVYRLGVLVPIPFLNADRVNSQLGIAFAYNTTNVHFSIFMLGIMPYISAYILIELLSLFFPYLKKLRQRNFEGRLKLKRISLVLASAMAIWQASSIINGLKRWNLPDGKPVLVVSNAYEFILLISVVVGSFYLLLVLCELISRFGIGHGISVVLLSDICGGFTGRAPWHFERFDTYGFFPFLIAAIAFCGIISFGYVLLRTKISIPCYHEKDNTKVNYFQLNLSPSSMAALTFASTLILLPATLLQVFETGSGLVDTLRPGSIIYNLASIFFVFTFSALFGWAFLHPRKRAEKMRLRGWHFADIDTAAESFLLKKLFIYNLPWTIFLCLMVVLPTILISSTNVPFYIGGSSLPVVVAVIMDLICGFRFYQNDLHRPIKIAEFHDIYDANMIQNHMEAVGIKSYLRGYHHRLLRYFLGPHLEISLIINEKDKVHAQTLIKDYYGGLGLIP